MGFEGINAVVSGGASGLGLGVVKDIVAKGGKAVILDINKQAAEDVISELGHCVTFYQVDMSNDEEVDAAMNKVAEYFSRVDLVVSCAGILGNGRILSKKGPMPSDFFRRVVDINLMGAFFLTRAAAQIMTAQEPDSRGERGVIVHTASIAAYEGQFGQVAYSATKAAIIGMILPLAREFARSGIRIMAIAPGIFETPMLDNVTAEIKASLSASIPFPSRLGTAAEFATLVEQIADNQMLNGSVIRLDGAARLQ